MQDDGINDDDDDDDDGEELAYTQAPSRSGEAASAADELPATGANTSSIALIGTLALAAGGAMYRVGSRRASVGVPQPSAGASGRFDGRSARGGR